MTYEETRDSEQLRFLDVAISEFIFRYQSNPATAGRQTIIFFPGGMGSQLMRANASYQDGVASPQTFSYEPVWLTLFTLLGDALHLKMSKDNDGVYRDDQDRIIVADGAVQLVGFSPYDSFVNWCEQHNLDWFIFGWDWRRTLGDTVHFF